jgi:hypothetical protein
MSTRALAHKNGLAATTWDDLVSDCAVDVAEIIPPSSGSAALTIQNATALATTGSSSPACAVGLSHTPAGEVVLSINGNIVSIGLAVMDSAYWSNDGGSTAKTPSAGDVLYWNGNVAGYQLAPTDAIQFTYSR